MIAKAMEMLVQGPKASRKCEIEHAIPSCRILPRPHRLCVLWSCSSPRRHETLIKGAASPASALPFHALLLHPRRRPPVRTS